MTETPWGDLGGRDGPEHPKVGGVPLCPGCGHHEDVQYALGRIGGYWCGRCNTTFATLAGEWAANTDRRALWTREYERTTDP